MDSKQYKKLYKQKKSEVKEYEKNISDLNKILSSLTDDMYDEIRNVNNKIDDLKQDLDKAVRHDSKFNANASNLLSVKEKGTDLDPELSVVIDELNEEIRRLSNLKSNAVADRDSYKQKYEDARDQDREEFWDDLF